MTAWPTESGRFALGDTPLQSGAVLPGAVLSWKTHGTLAPGRDNVVLYPTSYGAQHPDLAWLIGPDGVLDPTRWFIVIPDMFGNGLSSSPSNTPGWPGLVTAWDNVQAQQRLLAQAWGVERLHAVYGWSMGAQQAYHWAALHPGRVSRAVVNCGSARTATHNRVFLKGLMAILEAAPEHRGEGRFAGEPAAALRAFGRVYAGWGLSQDFYRADLHRTALGAPDLDTFLRTDWEERFARRRAADLYAQLRTWEAGDISRDARYGGDLARALGAIEARVLLMPGETDLYFRVADNAAELPFLRDAALRPIPSLWGHRAGNPAANPADADFLKRAVRDWLG
ncbi:Homoserine O-succinyltransferase [Methylobacterium crusticola]|uniref:Homoserine O-succinyltransferase n=1 Tax=Methylobacterium crusticola TaxID=1697972 RepID=A0ABQ4R4Z2_9HYPH|nr:alpha/beta fold hydrolase [Methylobacterium crusticola]GJD51802.1 Homoserine O-succinyltransferase [Methylobacterium crusticola]